MSVSNTSDVPYWHIFELWTAPVRKCRRCGSAIVPTETYCGPCRGVLAYLKRMAEAADQATQRAADSKSSVLTDMGSSRIAKSDDKQAMQNLMLEMERRLHDEYVEKELKRLHLSNPFKAAAAVIAALDALEEELD